MYFIVPWHDFGFQPAIILIVPILLPVAKILGIDPVHFGLVVTANLAIGMSTPPVGITLFVASGDFTNASFENDRTIDPHVDRDVCVFDDYYICSASHNVFTEFILKP